MTLDTNIQEWNLWVLFQFHGEFEYNFVKNKCYEMKGEIANIVN